MPGAGPPVLVLFHLGLFCLCVFCLCVGISGGVVVSSLSAPDVSILCISTVRILRCYRFLTDGLLRLSDGLLRQSDGLLRLADGLLRLSDGLLRLSDGLLRLSDGGQRCEVNKK